jgi:endonuclease/exonuclease/phosphatase family metal-dependent hydrolase
MFLIGHADWVDPTVWPKLSNMGLLFPIILAINFAFLVFWIFVKPRWVLMPLLGFILCYGPVRKYFPINWPEDPPKGCIKVLSYNVWFYAGWEDRSKPNPILEYIKQQNADIVCLQESAENEVGSVQVDSILGKVYQYKDTAKNGGDFMTIFSKYPILSKEHIRYESKSNMSCAFKLRIRHRDVIVINNHLETTDLTSDEKERFQLMIKGDLGGMAATRTSKWLISHIAYHSGTPMIVCGDFNDSPLSYANRTIAKGLTDCYVKTGFGPGISYHRSRMYVRIDNIMCTQDFTPYACKVDNSIKNSDHYPIMCWLKP